MELRPTKDFAHLVIKNVKIRKRKKQQPKLYNLRKPLLLPVEKIQQIPSNKSYSNLPKKIERDVSTVTKKWDFQEYNANVALYTATRIGCPKTTNVFSITQKWVSKNFKNRSLRSIMVKLPKFDSFSFLYIIFYFLLPKFTTLLFTNIHYYSFLFHILQAAQTLLMATSETFELMNMITTKLNGFFGQISYRNYQFENTTQVKKNEQDRKQKALRKAFRIYKKKKINQLSSDLGQKEKQKALSRNWQKLCEQQKLKYLETSKLMQKKTKKKKQDQAFRPQADQ